MKKKGPFWGTNFGHALCLFGGQMENLRPVYTTGPPVHGRGGPNLSQQTYIFELAHQ